MSKSKCCWLVALDNVQTSFGAKTGKEAAAKALSAFPGATVAGVSKRPHAEGESATVEREQFTGNAAKFVEDCAPVLSWMFLNRTFEESTGKAVLTAWVDALSSHHTLCHSMEAAEANRMLAGCLEAELAIPHLRTALEIANRHSDGQALSEEITADLCERLTKAGQFDEAVTVARLQLQSLQDAALVERLSDALADALRGQQKAA